VFPQNDSSLDSGNHQKIKKAQLHIDSSSIIKHYDKSNSRAMFLQSPYIEHYPEWFLSLATEVKFAYAGYGISLSNYIEGQFNSPLIHLCRYLLAASPYEVMGYQKYLDPQTFVFLTGNPLMFELRKILSDSTATQGSFRSQLLWAPHWSKDWLNGKHGFAQWKKTVGAVLEFANLNPLIAVVVRPHPILREAITASQLENRLLKNREALKSIDLESDVHELDDFVKLIKLPNVILSTNTLVEDVLRSSHLITDGVSIIGYWATTGKPMLIVESEEGSPFNEDGKLIIAISDHAESSEEITNWLNKADFTSRTPINIDLQELSRNIHPTFSKSPMQIFHESIH
jgi:hypothetical protein